MPKTATIRQAYKGKHHYQAANFQLDQCDMYLAERDDNNDTVFVFSGMSLKVDEKVDLGVMQLVPIVHPDLYYFLPHAKMLPGFNASANPTPAPAPKSEPKGYQPDDFSGRDIMNITRGMC